MPGALRAQGAGQRACLPPVQPAHDGTSFELPASAGAIRLPPGTVSEPLGANADGRKFILEDSTVLEIWVTPEPLGGLSAVGVTSAGAVQTCDGRIGRFAVVVTRVAFAAPSGDSVYLGMLNITLGSRRFLNIVATTANTESRDAIVKDLPSYLRLR